MTVDESRRIPRVQEQQEQLFADIVENAMDAIITVDSNMRIVVFNRAASEMFRWPASEMLGQTIDRLIPLHRRATHGQHVHNYRDHGTTGHLMGHSREVRGLRANGETFPIEASISRVGHGEDALMTVIARDVTEQHEAEATRRVQAGLEASHRARADFLSRMSHELRTPLNAVMSFTRMLRTDKKTSLSMQQLANLDHVLEASDRLRLLIDEMLNAKGRPTASGANGADVPSTADPFGLVLYIEDNDVNAIVVKQLLARWPRVQVEIAPTGAEGLSMARSMLPDLVLLDMHLPDIGGVQVARELRNDEATRHLPIVALSANEVADDVQAALAAGVSHYWSKPIDFDAFLVGVESLLAASHRNSSA